MRLITGWQKRIGLAATVAIAIAALVVAEERPAPRGTAEPATKIESDHWAFQPVARPSVPAVKAAAWVRNPIDAFALEKLEDEGFRPAPPADRTTLIRRATFDLTGLPPTPEEVDAFLADQSADAYEKLIDRLLASPRSGERWARHWLDLARYAESNGFKSDVTRPHLWRYRDWVIKALNEDKPYDQFVREQLAGDELAPGDAERFIATGFLRLWPYEDNGKVPELQRQQILEDLTDTTGSVFLGVTLGCARCHDHKFDPIPQRDYYRIQAFFAATAAVDDYPLAGDGAPKPAQPNRRASKQDEATELRAKLDAIETSYRDKMLSERKERLPSEAIAALGTAPEKRSQAQRDLVLRYGRLLEIGGEQMTAVMTEPDQRQWKSMNEKMKKAGGPEERTGPQAMGMTDLVSAPPKVFLLKRGNYRMPGEQVEPGFLSVVTPAAAVVRPVSTGARESSGRRTRFAEWITRPDNPLTARVMVNRIWQHHFGRGIVGTPSDFGTAGEEPTHPELLDWLASEFVAHGWSIKAMHRLMMTSNTYRQSTAFNAEAAKVDPDNKLLWRMNRQRLEGEAIRDAMLAASGLLNPKMGGPSVFPELPPGITTRGGWTPTPDTSERARRSIYVFARRNFAYPLFQAFDAPDANVTCARRNVTTTAPQALMVMNSDLVLQYARAFAGRVAKESRADAVAQIDRAYRWALGRPPAKEESESAVAFLDRQARLLAAEMKKDAGKKLVLPEPAPKEADLDRPHAAALVDFCHVLFGLNEFVYVD